MTLFARLSRWTVVVVLTASVLAVVQFVEASPQGLAAANQVSQASYYDFMDNWLYTHVGDKRGIGGPEHDLCRENVRFLLQSYGLSVVLEPFTYQSVTYYNVVATKTGLLYPSRQYIIGAHYDSVNNPGADDNASGVAAVLEIARILSQYPSDCTIKFIAFDREEQGLIGSNAYVSAHSGDDIRGMVSLDMVAYDTGTNTANIYGRTASDPIKNAVATAVSLYGNGLTPLVGGDVPQSDHAPFEAANKQACLLIEGEVWSNPYYHTQQDSFEQAGNLNFPFAVKMTRSIAGWLVDQAGVAVPVYGLSFTFPNGLPEFSYPNGTTRVRVVVGGLGSGTPQPGTGLLHYNTGSGWQSTPMDVVSDNVYDAVLPAAACGGTLQYYVSAQTVLGETFLEPYNAPAQVLSATVAYGRVALYENMFDSNPGWSTQGLWAFGQPTGGGSYNHDPTSGHTGQFVYGYNLNGNYENNLAVKYLTMPPVDCTGRYGVTLEFWRWLGVESNDNYDKADIEISNNGTTWSYVWRATNTGAAVSDASWQYQKFDISAIANNQPAVRIRWNMGPTDGYVAYPGWNIDDVVISTLDCEPPCPGPADGDLDGNLVADGLDIQWFVNALLGSPTQSDICHGDFSADGTLSDADIPGMVAVLLGE